MASTLAVLLLSVCLFTVTVSGNHCQGYFDKNWKYNPPKFCLLQCCGTCNNRYCCLDPFDHLPNAEQNACNLKQISGAVIGVIVVGAVIFIMIIGGCIACCCCSSCCIYKMCRRPRPVVGTHVTTVTNMQCIQPQPVVQAVSYPQYQPVPTQQGQCVQTMLV
ncbi:hypothetical protein QQF64_019389 [Cirrhinus molitorella]|uniref:Protein shisa-5 n=1 Tax=Cirrhinus molitorella TaxID=172907 RepID=A0ABR3LFC9_9TELE